MTELAADIVDQAITWHLRLPDAAQQVWVEFIEWLEADPAHAAAYDRIVEDEILAAPTLDLAQEGRASVERVVETRTRWYRRTGWMVAGGGALAASLAMAVYLPGNAPAEGGRYEIVTAPGDRRDVTLADGTKVEMNGGTRLMVDRDDSRSVSLKQGQAVFHVKHDESHPFEIAVGDTTLRDIGTVFDVTREGDRMGVQVAEGAVMYEPNGEALTLREGMALTTHDGDDRLMVGRVPVETIGAWRQGRLTFRETPLRTVAAAVKRTTGQDLIVGDEIADMPFTGSIRLGHDAAANAAHVAALVGVSVRRDESRWILVPGRHATD